VAISQLLSTYLKSLGGPPVGGSGEGDHPRAPVTKNKTQQAQKQRRLTQSQPPQQPPHVGGAYRGRGSSPRRTRLKQGTRRTLHRRRPLHLRQQQPHTLEQQPERDPRQHGPWQPC